jgi:hypothetical protein
MKVSRIRWPLAYLALAALALAPSGRAAAQEVAYDPAAVKAAFLYHFSTFVKWPGRNPGGEPFTIAVLGDDVVARQLEQYLPGRQIEGRPMGVRRIESTEELAGADVLFVGAERADDLEGSIQAVRDAPVLVVSDAPDALDRGAMINFTIVERRVRFEVSLRAVERAGLALSSRLLASALQVRTTDLITARNGWIAALTPGAILRGGSPYGVRASAVLGAASSACSTSGRKCCCRAAPDTTDSTIRWISAPSMREWTTSQVKRLSSTVALPCSEVVG